MLQTNVYVDGFNLYYALKDTPEHKWLDLLALCQRLPKRNTINRIRYFTAKVQERPEDPEAPKRQEVYLRALRTIPNLSMHFGRFRSDEADMRLKSPPPDGPERVTVIRTVEKRSDVNLATEMLVDAHKGDARCMAVLTNESDLIPPIKAVRDHFRLPVVVLNPRGRNQNRELRKAAPTVIPIRQHHYRRSQFADEVEDAKGKIIVRPREWAAPSQDDSAS